MTDVVVGSGSSCSTSIRTFHVIAPGGALDADGRWHAAKRRGYLFPLGIMSTIFRGKFLAGLTALKEREELPPPPGGWPKLWKTLGRTPWVVYCKRPFAGPEQVLSYLSNYTHRVAISERRIEAMNATARTVTFRWRDYREKDSARALKRCTLAADEFCGGSASICSRAVSPRCVTTGCSPTTRVRG